jgi:hypothetical protein
MNCSDEEIMAGIISLKAFLLDLGRTPEMARLELRARFPESYSLHQFIDSLFE